MGYNTFQIFVDSLNGIYNAGSNITGRVIVVTEKPKKVRGLKIEFSGKAKVFWTETELGTKSPKTPNRRRKGRYNRMDDDDESDDGDAEEGEIKKTVEYHGEEEYYSNKYFLLGSDCNELVIPAGENIYPFSTRLPPELPDSFDGAHGNIRYIIKATIIKPKRIEESTSLLVTVVTPVDLNLIPQAKNPVKREADKTFCCLWCKSGPLTLAGSIPFRGYTPGQTIVATLEVDNASNVRISTVKCQLKKELKWIAKSPCTKQKYNEVDLATVKLEGVPPNGSKSWTQKIIIPKTAFVNLDACSLIKVSYSLKVEACAAGPHNNLELTFPITLGTVPIHIAGSHSSQQRAPPPPYSPSAAPPPYSPSAPSIEVAPGKWDRY